MDFHPKKFPTQKESSLLKSGAGFTLIETLVATGILLGLLAVVLANYQRGAQESALHREAELFMSNIRLVQEQTAAGQIVNYCLHYVGADCLTGCSGYSCSPKQETPKGGFGLLVGCQLNSEPGWDQPWIIYGANNSYPSQNSTKKQAYYLFSDNRACWNNTGTDYCCYPLTNFSCIGYDEGTGDAASGSDGIVTTRQFTLLKGDTLEREHVLDKQIEFKDLRLTRYVQTTGSLKTYSCRSVHPDNHTPWRNLKVPQTNSMVISNYHLAALLRFLPPNGRKVVISDNIADYPPDAAGQPDKNNPWLKAEVMLGIKNRATDCRVVSVSKEGVISQSVDSDCAF
ncbi:hypothetical protein C4546_01440 [Candidatus Parcubacteria bacterium]|jgi:type II secretory pathway pseudopilin PulG|nr:MAG: hypothetical protein C4546_01440 [Candidatus Parcubacteria bacterium]